MINICHWCYYIFIYNNINDRTLLYLKNKRIYLDTFVLQSNRWIINKYTLALRIDHLIVDSANTINPRSHLAIATWLDSGSLRAELVLAVFRLFGSYCRQRLNICESNVAAGLDHPLYMCLNCETIAHCWSERLFSLKKEMAFYVEWNFAMKI